MARKSETELDDEMDDEYAPPQGAVFLCIRDCYDQDQYYRKGERYAIDPKSPIAKHFRLK